MKALIFLVEGETEQEFVNRILAPYLVTKGLNTEIRPIMIEKRVEVMDIVISNI